ncbi:hypothetical protein L917_06458 [Phytophthora nicotianae]|uniref:Uncharacterized protein n=1 Tax=Phytophthora nicotianae TaxID=4792 RepID=W2LEH1_PHYNI|nr:hypothetical protein L917_06458 [Phytophthora nicotianae]
MKKRRKRNTTAKRLRAQKNARAAATHKATVTSCTTTSQAVPEAEAVSETERPASEAAPEGSIATVALTDAVSVGSEPYPVTKDSSTRGKKKRVLRTALASAHSAALEEEEEASRAQMSTTQSNITKVGELKDSSICRTATTDLTHYDTNYVSSDTNTDSDSNCEMYWRIYGKNYDRSKLTVTANYASTKKKWQVARINDRRGDSLLEYKYQVLWVNPLVKRRRYYQRTWEPRAQLLADDFWKEIELVDR